MDEVTELLVEAVEVQHFVVVLLQVVVLCLEQVVELLGQILVLRLECIQVVDQNIQLFLETLGLERVVDQRGRVDGFILEVFNQVVCEPFKVLVLVVAVDLRLQIGALLEHGASALDCALEAHLCESERFPADHQ